MYGAFDLTGACPVAGKGVIGVVLSLRLEILQQYTSCVYCLGYHTQHMYTSNVKRASLGWFEWFLRSL